MSSMEILLVEDNLADVVFFREAVHAARVEATLQVVSNGEDAIRFLRRQGPYAQAPRPDVIVLDLNLPMKNGREVLLEMEADPTLREIPVAVLSTSISETHVVSTYTPGLCTYFVKTDEFNRLQDIVRQIAAHARARA
jgi:CheY-like chemotaxis protein